MDINWLPKITYTFDELLEGDIYSYPNSATLYMKVREHKEMKEMHFPYGVIQISVPDKDQPLVKRKCELSIYE